MIDGVLPDPIMMQAVGITTEGAEVPLEGTWNVDRLDVAEPRDVDELGRVHGVERRPRPEERDERGDDDEGTGHVCRGRQKNPSPGRRLGLLLVRFESLGAPATGCSTPGAVPIR